MITGPKPFALFIVHSLLFGVALVIIYSISLLVTESRQISLLTVGLSTLWLPVYKRMVPVVMPEMLATVLIAGTLWALLVAIRRPSLLRFLLIGLLIGFSTLTKQVVLSCAAVSLVFVLFSGQDKARQLRYVLAMLLGMSILLVPWTIRNYAIAGKILPVTSGGGYNFWFGNWPGSYERANVNKEPKWVGEIPQDQRDTVLMKKAVGYVKDHPIRATGIFAQKFSALWLGKIGHGPESHKLLEWLVYSRHRWIWNSKRKCFLRIQLLLCGGWVVFLISRYSQASLSDNGLVDYLDN